MKNWNEVTHCEQCGKELGKEDVPPLCLEHYIECMESYEEAMAEGLAEFIIKMGKEPGITIHFPIDEGMKKIENGVISDSEYGRGRDQL